MCSSKSSQKRPCTWGTGMGAGLAPVQEAATVPRADLPPQSVLKGILCSGHGLVHVADLGQGFFIISLPCRI